jgi:hypothetical protein
VGNRNDKGCNFGKMTLIAVGSVEELKFDHVTIVAVEKKDTNEKPGSAT